MANFTLDMFNQIRNAPNSRLADLPTATVNNLNTIKTVLNTDPNAYNAYVKAILVRIGRVSIIFDPYYLNGKDPMFGMSYYDLLVGMDITAFPSYYEPWGYTPLESVAFHVPTITTSLAGFGAWADGEAGVTVLDRNDSNYWEVVRGVANAIFDYAALSHEEREAQRKAAYELSKEAEWRHFFKYYKQAYQIALKKAAKR